MKINKKVLSMITFISMSLAFTGCTSNTSKEDAIEPNITEETISLENLSTYEDISLAYKQNFQKINNKESLRELDENSISKDTVLDMAKKSSEIAVNIENPADQLDVVTKLVQLDDLTNHASDKVICDVLRYIISEYENNQLINNDRVLEYTYITKYLDLELAEYSNMKDAQDMVFDMYQISKDKLRNITESIDSNINQVNKKIDSVKASLDM